MPRHSKVLTDIKLQKVYDKTYSAYHNPAEKKEGKKNVYQPHSHNINQLHDN
jgi:hypothetical protein